MSESIDTPETTEVDVETLMGLIQRRVHGLPDARHIMGEIERLRLKTGAVVTGRIEEANPQAAEDASSRPRSNGWRVGLRGRVATLILRAVRMNFRFQEVFNNSVVGVLQLIAEDLYAYEKKFKEAGGLNRNGRSTASAFDRVAFEERHLDAKPFCRRSLSLFRELLREDDVALELFCGRGELLATFAENHIEAVGVDPDAIMVSVCRERGVRARHADIFEHLRDSPDASYGGIFAARMVERLTADQTAELLKLVKRKLRRGGIFVASATNMDYLPALKKFCMDPNLIRPVPARLLGFMVERSNLRIDRFIFSGAEEQGGEDLSEPALAREVYPYDEYTVVAITD